MDRAPAAVRAAPQSAGGLAHVILLHGLRMNRHVMRLVQERLSSDGMPVTSLGYPSSGRDLQHNVAQIAGAIGRIAAPRIDIVAHSYGGVIALAALGHRPDPRVRRIVLLGSPVGGCRAGVDVQRLAIGRWFVGASAQAWSHPPALAIPPGVEAGSIAGTGRIGLGRFFTRNREPNDGVVTVEETKLPGLADHLVLPVAHSLMLASGRVAAQVIHFLHHGRFQR